MEYHYELNEEPIGPVPEAGIISLFHSKQINGDTLVWNSNLTDWSPLKSTDLWAKLKPPVAGVVVTNPVVQRPPPPPPPPPKPAPPPAVAIATAATATATKEGPRTALSNLSPQPPPPDNVPSRSVPEPVPVLGPLSTLTTSDQTHVPGSTASDWKEVLDKATGKTYYVNKITRDRQWKKPEFLESPTVSPAKPAETTGPSKPLKPQRTVTTTGTPMLIATAIPHSGAVEAMATAAAVVPMAVLPPSNAPPPPPKKVDPQSPAVHEVDKLSRRLTFRDKLRLKKEVAAALKAHKPKPVGHAKALQAADHLDATLGSTSCVANTPFPNSASALTSASASHQAKVDRIRRASAVAASDVCYGTAGTAEDQPRRSRLTVSQMTRQGGVTRSGFLCKQSKLLGRWKRRYFVLEDDKLTYYEKISDATSKRNGKSLLLDTHTKISFTSQPNCFSVNASNNTSSNSSSNSSSSNTTANNSSNNNASAVEEGLNSLTNGFKDPNVWFMEADSQEEVEDWMKALLSHIHKAYIIVNNVTTDFFDVGVIETSFWKVPEREQNAVGIRTLPFANAPRTNEGVYPGEVVEVVQAIKNDENIFLRLADDRGWIFQFHPKARYDLVLKVPGDYLEEEATYTYPGEYTESLATFVGPSFDSEVTGASIAPGSVFGVSAVWLAQSIEGTEFPLVFAKLSKDRSWVTLSDVDTGEVLLHKLHTSS